MKKQVLLLLCALALLLGGCAAAPEAESDSILLGFSQLGSESSWRLGNSRDIQRAAADAGVQLMFENAEQKQENQIKAIRSFIAYQVDVIAFSPIVEDGWDNVLQEAKDAGIPVILIDRAINTADPSLYAGSVGADFHQEGVSAGEFLLRKAQDMDDAEINIVEIAGTTDSTPMRQRAAGFREAIAGDARFHIIDSISGDFLRSKGKECMRGLLEKYDDIDVLYSHNDGMTLGALEAIEEAGLVPGRDIVIITVDGEQASIDLLAAGKINCVVECTPMLGDILMELSQKLARGEDIPAITHPAEAVFCEYDADLDALPDRGY